jgi:hypothetical protein
MNHMARVREATQKLLDHYQSGGTHDGVREQTDAMAFFLNSFQFGLD